MKKVSFCDQTINEVVCSEIKSTKEVECYYMGSPKTAFVCELKDGYYLYAFKAHYMGCYTKEDICAGAELFYTHDVDFFAVSKPIESIEDLIRVACS